MFKKLKNTGVVVNTETFDAYKRQRENVKSAMKTEKELKTTKLELQGIKEELADLKSLLKQLVEK